MAKENVAKYIILGLLSHDSYSGYEIKKWVENSISYFWDISYGQIYPTLRRLEQEELATKEIEESERGPNRKRYSITEKGEEELENWLKKPEKKTYEVLLKIFFGRHLSDEENIEKMQKFIEMRKKDIYSIKKSEKELLKALGKDEDHLHFLIVALFGINAYSYEINLSEKIIELLKAKNQDKRRFKEVLNELRSNEDE